MRARARVIFVDFHAEATSEKKAMGWHLDGRVTAVAGTHTHVQTADERLLPKGTAYITDAGMTGPHDSIIGVTVDAALSRFVSGMPSKFEAATTGARLNAVIVTADPASGKATAIERVNLSAAEVETLAEAHASARL
jgi:metallophosphoesterase (TIGR00282 family)